jgi:hypothetical protein
LLIITSDGKLNEDQSSGLKSLQNRLTRLQHAALQLYWCLTKVITPVGQIGRQVPKNIPELGQVNMDNIWDNAPPPTEFDIESVVLGECKGFKQLFGVYRQIQTGKMENFRGWMQPVEGIPF